MEGSDRHDRGRRRPGAGSTDDLVELHVCPECDSRLVHPLDWTVADDVHWRVSLRCPECEWSTTGLFEQAVLDRFDQVLDAGTDALHADLRRLERMNMEAELRRFSAAIGDDLILPDDF
ncbi:MAG: hypothetical protein R2718_10865 [Solirubrobacterales bacterium]